MELNFVMLVTGHLQEAHYGQARSAQEFRDRYMNGEYEKEDQSEPEQEELFVRDFDCPKCKQRTHWAKVDGPNGNECMIQCKHCQCNFAVGMNDCAKCIDRVTKCLAVIPPKGLHMRGG